ncbi:MAG: Mitochondrial fission protein [Peltula sp. TS41687]|nr:MAG: Mitochondrial fission protein [Peltula sp. TS41687]
MASSSNRDASPPGTSRTMREEESGLGGALSTRNIEAFSRKVTTTAGHLIGPFSDVGRSSHYVSAMEGIHKELRQPKVQRRMFSLAQASPAELVRSKLSTSEIQYRALTYLPDELLENIPEDENTYSLFQGFQATLPEISPPHHKKGHRRHGSRGRKLLDEHGVESHERRSSSLGGLKKEKHSLSHRLEMLGIRKNLASSEIREIDNKINNLNNMRRVVLDRLAGLEQEETVIEHDLLDLDNRIEDMQDETEELSQTTPPGSAGTDTATSADNNPAMNASFMSESIYEKLPSPKSRRHKTIRRKSMPILHEHYEPGTSLKQIQAHNDMITALDFDVPFGTMVTAALDDTVRVWDLNAGRCMGMLEGHHASVRCLQVEDNIVATGSTDATIRLWDLSRADYQPPPSRRMDKADQQGEEEEDDVDDDDDNDGLAFADPDPDAPPPPSASSMRDCALFTLEAHVDEVTALHLHGETLVSGSADKTLRQWDLVKGRCIQTLDVLWAAAQASTTSSSTPTSTSTNTNNNWRPTNRLPDASADFVGALQCFDAALACGTADGMVRLWDLRSGQVHRSLVGHTGPVTCLQFDDVHLVTGSLDRSIRIWDLRTGSIFDAYAYTHPITSMQFDPRRIVVAAGEDVVKVYDKGDGRHWDCGVGVAAKEEGGEGDGRGAGAGAGRATIVEKVRIKDGYLIEGRRDGVVGIWAC